MNTVPLNVVIPDQIADAAHLSEPEARLELAVILFQADRLTLGQASALAGLPIGAFMRLLGSRRIPLHHGVEELREDLRTLDELADPK